MSRKPWKDEPLGLMRFLYERMSEFSPGTKVSDEDEERKLVARDIDDRTIAGESVSDEEEDISDEVFADLRPTERDEYLLDLRLALVAQKILERIDEKFRRLERRKKTQETDTPDGS